MSIERIPINSNFGTLKTALERLVPKFFASVSLSQDERTITCKDADDNTIFTVARSANNNVWTPTAYRSANSYISPLNSASYSQPFANFYDAGDSGAFITLNQYGGAILIAKASNGRTAIVMPASASGYSVAGNNGCIYSACWGDDTSFNTPIAIADQTNPAVGNSCLMVPVPLNGSYTEAVYVQNAFMLTIAQPNMRGIEQEVVGDEGPYVTNGYLALKFDS